MRLTTRGRYAVTALLDLALQASTDEQPITLAEIAARSENRFLALRRSPPRSYR